MTDKKTEMTLATELTASDRHEGIPRIYCRTVEEAKYMGIVMSQLNGESVAANAAKIIAGQELGIPPAAACREIYLIKERQKDGSVKIKTMISPKIGVGLVRQSGTCGFFSTKTVEEGSFQTNPEKTYVEVRAKRKGSGEDIYYRLSLKQALAYGWPLGKEGRIKPAWKANPIRMLSYRAHGTVLALYWQEVFMGMPMGDLSEGDYDVEVAPPEAPALTDDDVRPGAIIVNPDVATIAMSNPPPEEPAAKPKRTRRKKAVVEQPEAAAAAAAAEVQAEPAPEPDPAEEQPPLSDAPPDDEAPPPDDDGDSWGAF